MGILRNWWRACTFFSNQIGKELTCKFATFTYDTLSPAPAKVRFRRYTYRLR